MGDNVETLSDYTIAPQHATDLATLEPYIIEGVAYSPLKTTSLHNYDTSLKVRCNSCEWETTVGQLPEDAGRIQPDMCPDCAKRGEIGHLKTQSPADGSFPSDWSRGDLDE